MAAARASGHLPRAPLVGFASALLALLACAWWRGPQLALELRALLVGSLGMRVEALVPVLRALAQELGLGLLLVVLVTALGVRLAQGPSAGSARVSSLPALRPSRLASAVFALGMLGDIAYALSDWTMLEPGRYTAALAELANAFALRLVMLTLACVLIDVAFARAGFYASLWMNRRDFLQEQREAFGSPEVRAARERERGRA